MADLIKIIAVFLVIAFIPHIIIAIGIYAAVYMFWKMLYHAVTDEDSGDSGGSRSYDDDPGDHWGGTGNPYV